MTDSLLNIRDLEVSYGAMQVLFGIEIDVQAGEIVSIIGPNGAGKSTVIKAVVGLVPAQRGHIVFGGADITNRPAHVIPALGIGYVPQGRIVFAQMTVADNLEMGAFLQKDARKRREAALWSFSNPPSILFPVIVVSRVDNFITIFIHTMHLFYFIHFVFFYQ